MRTLSPLTGRTPDVCPGRSGFSLASSLIWGIPRWKAGSGSCFYTSWQVTDPAPRSHRLLCLLERSPPQRQKVAIPAQDSWRTTAVPCMREKTYFLRHSFGFRIASSCAHSVESLNAQRPATLANFSVLRTELPLLSLKVPRVLLSSCRLPISTALLPRDLTFVGFWLARRAALGARVVFPRRPEAARKVPTLQIKTIQSFLCDFSSCEISWIWRSDISVAFKCPCTVSWYQLWWEDLDDYTIFLTVSFLIYIHYRFVKYSVGFFFFTNTHTYTSLIFLVSCH